MRIIIRIKRPILVVTKRKILNSGMVTIMKRSYVKHLFTIAVCLLISQTCVFSEPVRFLVLADPQFELKESKEWKYTSNVWKQLPGIQTRLNVTDVFICGDLFGGGQGDGSTLEACWNEWDRYASSFQNPESVHWVLGGHEFYRRDDGMDPLAYYKERYNHPPRKALRKGNICFVLMDNMHSPTMFDDKGLEWLEQTLEENKDAKHIFIIHHVGPRNTLNWWNDSPVDDEKIPQRAHADDWREKYADILSKYPVTAAFSGHDHSAKYMGNRGGFEMFTVGVRFPMLVEIDEKDEVHYSWLLQPVSADPLGSAEKFDPDRMTQVKNFTWAQWDGELPDTDELILMDREEILNHTAKKNTPWQNLEYKVEESGLLKPVFPSEVKGAVILKGSLRHGDGWSGIAALIKFAVADEEGKQPNAFLHLWVGNTWQGIYRPFTSGKRYHAITVSRTPDHTLEFTILLTEPRNSLFDLRCHSIPPFLSQAQD